MAQQARSESYSSLDREELPRLGRDLWRVAFLTVTKVKGDRHARFAASTHQLDAFGPFGNHRC